MIDCFKSSDNIKIIMTKFEPGLHSFYGIANVEILEGNPSYSGVILGLGFHDIISAPIYGLPITFES